MRPVYWLVIVALIIGAGVLYLSSRPNNLPQPVVNFNPQTTIPVGGGPGNVGISQVTEFTVTAQSFEFNPKEIRVKKGDTVRITLKNLEGMHDFVLDEFNVKTRQIQTGETDIVEFVADKAGEFEYFCSVNNHRQMGMVGKLIVENP